MTPGFVVTLVPVVRRALKRLAIFRSLSIAGGRHKRCVHAVVRTQGPIRRGGCCLNDLVNGFASTITAGGYGSLLSQGRRWRCDKFNTTAAPGVALAKPGQI